MITNPFTGETLVGNGQIVDTITNPIKQLKTTGRQLRTLGTLVGFKRKKKKKLTENSMGVINGDSKY